jgi:hypothetical protein
MYTIGWTRGYGVQSDGPFIALINVVPEEIGLPPERSLIGMSGRQVALPTEKTAYRSS